MKFISGVMLLLLTTQGLSLALDGPSEHLQKGQPKDVGVLINRIVGCNHWLGEEPYDQERYEDIQRATARLQCDKLERHEALIRAKYQKSPNVLSAIDAAHNIYW